MDTSKYESTILAAVLDLGELSRGERVDLLLDNHPEIRDSRHAREIIDTIESNIWLRRAHGRLT